MKKFLLPLIAILLFGSSCAKSSKPKTPDVEDRSLTVYAINDYHGMVNSDSPIEKLGSFIKEKTSQDDTLFFDQGDSMQGTLDSNYNHGRLITDVYNAAHMTARTVGNHDFDWGIDKLVANKNASYEGYSATFLAANVYDFNQETKKQGTTQQSNIGQEYTIATTKNGLKVGVIGVIGEENITVITADRVKDICFTNPVDKIKEVSDKLRKQEKCDVVIVSAHTGDQTLRNSDITRVSPVSDKRYVDLVLCGHTHKRQTHVENGVYFVQYGDYGECVGEIKMTVKADGKIETKSTNEISASTIRQTKVDSAIQTIIDSYKSQTKSIGEQVVAKNASGSFSRYEYGPNFVCKAMYEAAKTAGYDCAYTITNETRMELHFSGPVKYADLYEAIPFDNNVYIFNALGSDIIRTLKKEYGNHMYRTNQYGIDENKKYIVAVIDYLAFHVNETRNEIYFPNSTCVAKITKSGETYTYFDMTCDYMKSFGDDEIKTNIYSNYYDEYNVSRLYYDL